MNTDNKNCKTPWMLLSVIVTSIIGRIDNTKIIFHRLSSVMLE